MLKGMDEDTKKMMDKIEETSFFKPSAKEEVKKYVDDGGMERNVMVDGAYRNIDDVDGNKLRKERRISALFWIVLATVVITVGVILCIMTARGNLEIILRF